MSPSNESWINALSSNIFDVSSNIFDAIFRNRATG